MKLSEFIKKNNNIKNVSYYGITKLMGANPYTSSNYWKRKIMGGVAILKEDAEKICKYLSEKTGKEIKLEDFDLEVTHIKFK